VNSVSRLHEPPIELGVLWPKLEAMIGVFEANADRERSRGVADLPFSANAVLQSVEYAAENPIVQTGHLE
jgi:hypothetical protein